MNKINHCCFKLLPLLGLLILFSLSAFAIEQTITLQPGWNAVYLEMEPNDHNPDTTNDARWETLLDGIPVEAVRVWNDSLGTIDFIENPGDISNPPTSNWDAYYPPDSAVAFLSTIYEAHAGNSYLIKLQGSVPVTLDIEGDPVLPEIVWKPDSFNFVGFHLEPGNEPFFGQFFELSPAHMGQEIYYLNTTTGTWDKVTDPYTTLMKSGEAYWVYCKGASDYQGPMEVLNLPLQSIDFGETLSKYEIKIKNHSPLANPDLPSGVVSNATIELSTEGTLPLSYWIQPPSDNVGWNNLEGPVFIGEESQQYTTLQLSVRRRDMGEASTDVLTLSNGQGFRLQLPVSASGTTGFAGLWVGYASIRKVSQAYHEVSPMELKATHKDFQIRLIVHVDKSGQANLLSQVIQMWKPGSTAYNEEYGGYVVVQPGDYALFTEESLIPADYQGAALVNGQTVGKRISSIHFSFTGKKPLSGVFNKNLALLSDNAISVGYDDPLNPYKHAYHPDHDNYNRYYDKTKLQEGIEVFAIKRELELDFTSNDPEVPASVSSINWGYSEVGGIYRETVHGLHRNNIKAEGSFRLYRISTVNELDPVQN